MADPDIAEEWRPVEGWPYEVSNLGRLRRASAELGRTKAGKIISVFAKESGHLRTRLSKEGKTYNCSVHRLICRVFHGEPPSSQHHAAHKDGNPSNNIPENLYWATALQNSADTIRHGRSRPGQANNLTKISDQQALEIRWKAYWAIKEIAAEYSVDYKTVKRILNRQTFRHLPVNRPPKGHKFPRSV